MYSTRSSASFLGKIRHFIVHDLLHADDTPHRLALAVAIGTFVAFTPTIPFQMMLTVALCWGFGANRILGLPVCWITNPATLVPIYFPQYVLGCWIMDRPVGAVDFGVLTRDHGGFWPHAEKVWEFTTGIFWPLWTGSLLVATIFGVAIYYVSRVGITKYRVKRYGQVLPPEPPVDTEKRDRAG